MGHTGIARLCLAGCRHRARILTAKAGGGGVSKIIGVIPTEWVALLGFHKLHKVIIGYDFVVLVHDDKPMRVHGIFRTAEM